MIRSTVLALFLLSTFPQESKPGWQTRLEAASRTPAAWKARRDEVRRQILVSAGLWPEFERPPLRSEVFGTVDGEDYTVVRVYGAWRATSRLTVKLRVENLLNERYEEVNGYPALGFGVFGGLELAF